MQLFCGSGTNLHFRSLQTTHHNTWCEQRSERRFQSSHGAANHANGREHFVAASNIYTRRSGYHNTKSTGLRSNDRFYQTEIFFCNFDTDAKLQRIFSLLQMNSASKMYLENYFLYFCYDVESMWCWLISSMLIICMPFVADETCKSYSCWNEMICCKLLWFYTKSLG